MHQESVYAYGAVEALRHRWIESQKAGRDLGHDSVRDWCRNYWQHFLRHRWLEHISGAKWWKEIDRGDFGLLQHDLKDETELLEIILEQLVHQTKENLDVINWAHATGRPVDRVIHILEVLDINSRRLDSIIEDESKLRSFLSPV